MAGTALHFTAAGKDDRHAQSVISDFNRPVDPDVFGSEATGLPFSNRMKLDNFVLPEQVIFAYEFIRK